MPKVRTGKAVRWNDEKGFGFITPDDGGSDVFVHRSALGESRDLRLNEGDSVEFEEIFDDRKGKTCASNVEVVSEGRGGGGRGGGGRGRRDDSRGRQQRYESKSPPRRGGGGGGRKRDDSRGRGRSRSPPRRGGRGRSYSR